MRHAETAEGGESVYIHEAIMNTTRKKPFITRKAWDMDFSELPIIKLLPTDTPDCCLIVSECSAHGPRRGWEPKAADLIADDWYPCYGNFSTKASRNKWK